MDRPWNCIHDGSWFWLVCLSHVFYLQAFTLDIADLTGVDVKMVIRELPLMMM